MSANSPPLPGPREWARFGIFDVVELHAGRQSRVFRAELDGVDVAIKLTDRQLADRAMLETRMAVVESLAADVTDVVALHRIDGAPVQPIAGWLMTAASFVTGEAVDVTRPGTAELLGRTLAALHAAMALVSPRDLPPVAALRAMPPDADRSGWQLLHGDFNEQNVIATSTGLRVFDFDDCGYGPIEYDVANTLYMVMFDAEVHGHTVRDDAFRRGLLAGYRNEADRQLDDDIIDALIDARVAALGRWLDDLSTAPIGIRTSSSEWQDVLRTFVRAHTSSSGVA
jgi:Ser/Thr protein kinase RdoA (MazF antagonist)